MSHRIVGSVIITWLLTGNAVSVFPAECLGDCGEVENVTYSRSEPATDILMVTTRFGTAFVAANFPRRPSWDGRMHACMQSLEEGMRLTCLFIAPLQVPDRG
jgi:hypothetical protein